VLCHEHEPVRASEASSTISRLSARTSPSGVHQSGDGGDPGGCEDEAECIWM
jgi:hypothetical protein